MRVLLALFCLLLASPAWAEINVVFSSATEVPLFIPDKKYRGVSGLTASNLEFKAWCQGDGATITTLNENEAEFAFAESPTGSGNYRLIFDAVADAVGQTIGEVCKIWAEGVGAAGGEVGATPVLAISVPRKVTGTVVSSGDCTNSATLFDTSLTEAGTNHWVDTFLTFLTGSLAGQTKQVVNYNGTTKCLTVRTPGFSATPSASDRFELVNR